MNNYFLVKVSGNVNRFLLRCNINLLKVKYISHNEIIIKIRQEDYNKLLKIYNFKYKIINKTGLIKLKDIINIHKVLIISFIIGIILLILMSNTIFDIRINTDNEEFKNIIRSELSKYGIDKYKFKKSFKEVITIKQLIIEKYKDNIEWIEISNEGTRVIVNIIERKINNDHYDEKIYSIIAKKPGYIKKILVDDGIKVIEEDNYVNKGEIIISPDIYLNDNLKGKVSATGKVYASVWYKVICEYPLNYKEKVYTGKKRKTIYVKIGNKYIDIFRYKNFERKELYSVKDDLTGITFGIEEIEKVKLINKKYSDKEAKEHAKEKSKEIITKKLNKDEYIISQKTLKFNSNGSKIILETFFSVYEEIGEKRVIEEN